MSHTGFTNPVKVKEGNILFGLLRTAYYHAGAGLRVNLEGFSEDVP